MTTSARQESSNFYSLNVSVELMTLLLPRLTCFVEVFVIMFRTDANVWCNVHNIRGKTLRTRSWITVSLYAAYFATKQHSKDREDTFKLIEHGFNHYHQ